MSRSLLTLACFSLLSGVATGACSSAPGEGDASSGGTTGTDADADAGTGGVLSGSGGSVGTGGVSATGGATAAGGSATGGTGNQAAYTCPTGFDGMAPDLTGKTASLLSTAPNMGAEAQVFLEGPVWVNDALYVSQLRTYGPQNPGRILKLSGTTLSEFIADTGTNGLAIRGDGRLLAASQKDFGIVSFDMAAPMTAPVVIADEFDVDPGAGGPAAGFNSPNDLTLRSDGNIYFTDPNYQCGENCPQGKLNTRVYRIDPTGAVTTIASTHTAPNGISLSPDENTLYVAGNGDIEKYTIAADGSVGARQVFAANSSGVDGMAVDCAGNVYTANHPSNSVGVYLPSGTAVAGSITVGQQITNVAFGGPNHTTLYITQYGTGLYSVELDIPGFPY